MFVLKVQGWKDKELVVECRSTEERDGWLSSISSLKKEAKKKRKSFKCKSIHLQPYNNFIDSC